MAELEIDQTNLPRVQEGKHTLSVTLTQACICTTFEPLMCAELAMVCPGGKVVFL